MPTSRTLLDDLKAAVPPRTELSELAGHPGRGRCNPASLLRRAHRQWLTFMVEFLVELGAYFKLTDFRSCSQMTEIPGKHGHSCSRVRSERKVGHCRTWPNFSFSRSSEIGLDAVALSRKISTTAVEFAIAQRAGQCRPSRGKDTAFQGGEVTRMRSFCCGRSPMEGDRLFFRPIFLRTSIPRARPGLRRVPPRRSVRGRVAVPVRGN